MSGGDTEISVASRKLAVVVGAGVAGCQSARALLRAGYDVLVLEQGRGLGGVWRSNYHSFGLQGLFGHRGRALPHILLSHRFFCYMTPDSVMSETL